MHDYFFIIGKNHNVLKDKRLVEKVSKKILVNNRKLDIHYFTKGFGIQSIIRKPSLNFDKIFFKNKNAYIFSNSRIDNKEELIEKNPELSKLSQSEIIFSLYEKYGDEIYKLIEGPFSFLIYYADNNSVVGGRDLFGQRPLYYINRNNYFAVSSDASAFSEFDMPQTINHDKILQFILNEHLKDGESFYQNIKKVNGGNSFVYANNEIQIRRYLKPESLISHSIKNKKDILNNFKKNFIKTITSILGNMDENLATTLSGGLDSSSLFLAANKINSKKNIYSFSVHFNGISKKDFLKTDEEFYLKKVLLKTSSIHKKIFLNFNESGPINNKRKILPFSQPYGVINGYMHEAIFNECKKNNIEFLVDGLFGDEVISHGIYRLNELLNKGNIFLFIYELFCLRKNRVIFSLRMQLNNFIFIPLKRVAASRFDFKKFKEIHLNDSSYFFSDNFNNNNFVREYKKTRMYHFKSDRDEQFKLFNSGLIEFALEQLYEISKQRNIETIYPFLDKRILKSALNVPVSLKLRNGVTRYYFKEAIKDLLPDELYNRKTKSNISPFAENQIQDKLDDILDNIFAASSMVKKYISEEKLNSLRYKKLTHSETLIVFNLYSLNYWLKSQNR